MSAEGLLIVNSLTSRCLIIPSRKPCRVDKSLHSSHDGCYKPDCYKLNFLLMPELLCSLPSANKHKPWIETEYQGIVMENDNTVLLNPPLFALDKDAPLHYAGEICGFRVHNGPSGSGSVQFEAVVLDRSTGEGLVRSKEPLDCESQREHSFTIQAYDCGEGPDGVNSKKSHKATVHVRVNDVNEFSPVFVERRYEASVPEGRLFDRIVRVEALDADCSPQYSQICFYDIITPNVPFAIDNDGNIKNTEPLDSKRERVHTFWVTAFDCGKNRAQADAQVVVTVKPSCKPGWIGWTKRVEYTPGSGSIPLFPSLHLETCEETVWNIQATVELQTGHIGKGCDRDSYSDRSVRRLCGAVRGEVDLLPPPSPAANWTSALPTLPSSDSSLVFSFNGSNHVAVVPDPVVSALSGDHFTLQLWMRRGGANIQPAATQTRGNRKEEETIVCSTVKNDDSFSHYSLSVHGCRLSLFYWPDVSAARPVKFLWKLEQVCDSEWHHLSLSVQFPSVTLYVDGVTFDPALIHDNGAIPNPAARQRMFIGACWGESRCVHENRLQIKPSSTADSTEGDPEQQYVGGYHGLLSGVTVRPGSVEPHSVVECLYACREGLDFGDLETLGSGMKSSSVSMINQQFGDTELFKHGLWLSWAMRDVTVWRRCQITGNILSLYTQPQCFNEESCLSLKQLEGYLVVLQPDAPQISLSGVGPHLARPAPEFEGSRGVPLFPELRIVCSLSHAVNTAAQGMEGGALMSDAVAHTLDGCEVQPLGEELNPEREELLVDMDVVRERGLEIINTTAYIAITGAESISVYEDVLRSVRYRLAKGSARFERRFRLSCSEMNGRYTSNELTLEVNFLHSLDSLYHPSHLLASQQQFLHPSHHAGELSGHTLPNPHRNSVVPGAATVIIMVCVGFLVVMVILGVFRIRSIHRRGEGARGGAKESNSQWDDSALTIIINPMESYESRMGISADTEGEGEEDEEAAESPDDASDDQRIIIKKEGRDGNARRY
uniref:Calsyntenin-3 n=1 Tax=Stegastes partitus TaxID=144197 RepID=A0A3B4ZAM3_9TELE